MLYLLGIMAIVFVIFLIINHFLAGMNIGIWFACFIIGVTIPSTAVVWGLAYTLSSRDFEYMESHLQYHRENPIITEHFMELYLEYDRTLQNRFGRMFVSRPSPLLQELFDTEFKVALIEGNWVIE